MSSDLTKSAAFYADPLFIGRVRAAVVENAAAKTTIANDRLARQIVWDPETIVLMFARLAANDATISSATVLSGIKDADIRRVVTDRWDDVARSMPSL